MSTENLENFKDRPVVGSVEAPAKIGVAALAFEVLEAWPRRGGWALDLFGHTKKSHACEPASSLIRIDSPMFISWIYLMNAIEMKH